MKYYVLIALAAAVISGTITFFLVGQTTAPAPPPGPSPMAGPITGGEAPPVGDTGAPPNSGDAKGQTPPMMSDPANGAGDDTAALKDLEKQYEDAKAAYLAKPGDADLKTKYVDATVAFGHQSMVSPSLQATVKYRRALKLYREALKLDPKNAVAKPETDLIVSIYKQMGRPVPE